MPWATTDEREVAEEIANNAARAGGQPVLPATSAAEMQRLHELVPELAEDTAGEAVDLAELVDESGLGQLPPGTTARPGPYFEPPEDEED